MLAILRSDFVVGWENIAHETSVGNSHGYSCDQAAVGTTNGAGARNVQIVVLAPDATVTHALFGFWHPEDLVPELKFGLEMTELWADQKKSRPMKRMLFRAAQFAMIDKQSEAALKRSEWQSFDGWHERSLAQHQSRDTVYSNADGTPLKDRHGRTMLKPLNVLVHERMSRRPFQDYDRFDMVGFSDYGQVHYDNNRGVDGGGVAFQRTGAIQGYRPVRHSPETGLNAARLTTPTARRLATAAATK